MHIHFWAGLLTIIIIILTTCFVVCALFPLCTSQDMTLSLSLYCNIHLLLTMFLFISCRDPAFEIVILDVFGFEEFQRNGFEQVEHFSFLPSLN